MGMLWIDCYRMVGGKQKIDRVVVPECLEYDTIANARADATVLTVQITKVDYPEEKPVTWVRRGEQFVKREL